MIPSKEFSIEQYIADSSPAQKLIWEQIKLFTGDRAAVQRYYSFLPLAGEMAIPAAGVCWFAYQLDFYPGDAAASANRFTVRLDNIPGNPCIFGSSVAFWNSVAAAVWYYPQTLSLKNVLFRSIITVDIQPLINFIGFKITY